MASGASLVFFVHSTLTTRSYKCVGTYYIYTLEIGPTDLRGGATAKVEDDADAPPLTGMAAVRAALRALRFGQYADAFEKLGFDDLDYLREVASAAGGRARIYGFAAQVGMKKGHAMVLASYLAGAWAPGTASGSGSV